MSEISIEIINDKTEKNENFKYGEICFLNNNKTSKVYYIELFLKCKLNIIFLVS